MGRERKKDVLTTGEVARICNVAPRTVSKWFDSGQLHGYRIPGSKDRRIPRDQLVRFMKAHDIPLNDLVQESSRVLIIDSDESMCRLLADTLGRDDAFEVVWTTSAFEAGIFLERERPNTIVLDVSLPDVDPAAVRRALQVHPDLNNVRLIAVSGALSEGQGEALIQDGYAAFLRKPFDVRTLRQAIVE